MERWNCDNIGGINEAYLSTNAGAWIKVGKFDAEILAPESFEAISIEQGQYTENRQEDESGAFTEHSISLSVRRDRRGLLEFEDRYLNREVEVLVRTNNGSLRLFERMRISRNSQSGEQFSDTNGASYLLRSQGISPAYWVEDMEEPGQPEEPNLPPASNEIRIIGDGATQAFSLSHTLGRKPRLLSVWRESDWRECILDVSAPNTTTIEALFAYPPEVGENYTIYLF